MRGSKGRLQLGQVGGLELTSPQSEAWNEVEVVKRRVGLFGYFEEIVQELASSQNRVSICWNESEVEAAVGLFAILMKLFSNSSGISFGCLLLHQGENNRKHSSNMQHFKYKICNS